MRKTLCALPLAALIPGLALAETPASALVMAYNIDAISTFDPAQVAEVVTDEILMNTCDALVDFDPEDEANFLPSLAESWDVSEDGLTVTFHLKDGIVYPDGTPGSAGDLVWGMQRVLGLGYGNAAQLTDFGFTKDNAADRITAPDDSTVVLTLDRPYPLNLVMGSVAANRVSVMLNRAEIEANAKGDDMGNAYLANRTACVGPYTLARWNAGEVVMLEASENYNGPAPKLSRVMIRHVAEPGTQRLMLEQGDIDVARNLNPDDLTAVEGTEGLRVERALKPSLFYMAMNNAMPPFDNPKVRLAMRYLIDYQGMENTVMKGIGVPRASFVQLGAFGALDKDEGQPFRLDIDKAKALLTEAGYPDGFTVPLILGSHPYADPIAQTIQEAASKVGITFKIERMANSQLFAKTRARDFQAAMLGFKTSVPDAHGMASRHVANPDNTAEAGLGQYPSWRSGYYDADMNARIDAALFERDPAKRAEMYHQLQRDVMQEGPQAYIMQTSEAAAVTDALTTWSWNGFRTYYDAAAK
ncbi:ABC transporter substrate-binding protein [Frigidibacter sp. MR17.24]|uniref:ABC transporter substrate-binding protein n=1 Tax=Frigidibacter sp. MR17.24 TaxID=3127345 RepID=UPI0030131AE8